MSNISILSHQVFMDVRQVASYLHLNEKKIYSLAGSGDIPATKVTGKWLFPRELIDKWILDSTHNGLMHDRLSLAGGDDILIQSRINQLTQALGSTAVITFTETTTRNALDLLNSNKINIAILNWGPDTESGTRHPALLQQYPNCKQWILVQGLRRERGIIVHRDIALDKYPVERLFDSQFRWSLPAEGSGAYRWLVELLSRYSLSINQLNRSTEAHSLNETAASINNGISDVGIGTRASSQQFHLGFLSQGWEQLDLVMTRDIWFRHLFHKFLEELGSGSHTQAADEMAGYDLTQFGKILWGNQ
jgi:putative molybdopterin biosynthesis protein